MPPLKNNGRNSVRPERCGEKGSTLHPLSLDTLLHDVVLLPYDKVPTNEFTAFLYAAVQLFGVTLHWCWKVYSFLKHAAHLAITICMGLAGLAP